MTATPWSRVNWKMCDENSTFCCFDAICTQFSVTWPHCGTVHYFFGSFNWPRLPSWIGFFTAAWRWQWQHVRAARARSWKQNTTANISVFCLQIWPSIKSRAINGFNKFVFGFYSHWKVWYKNENAFGKKYTGRMETWQLALRARCHVSIRQSPSLCNAILNTCPCLLAI